MVSSCVGGVSKNRLVGLFVWLVLVLLLFFFWGGDCNQLLINKIIQFQKRTTRLILKLRSTNDNDFEAPSHKLFAEPDDISERVKYQNVVQIFKIVHNQAPVYLNNTFTHTSEVHDRLLQSSSNMQAMQLYLPKQTRNFTKVICIFSTLQC